MVYLWNLFITLDNSPSSVILTVFFFSQYCYWMCFRHSLLYCCRCIMYACIPFFSFGFRWILYGKKICEIKRKRKWNKKEKKMVNDFYTYLLSYKKNQWKLYCKRKWFCSQRWYMMYEDWMKRFLWHVFPLYNLPEP